MPLGREVGLGPCDIVIDGDPAAPSQKGQRSPIFGSCLLWQTTGLIKLPLGMEVGFGPGHIVLHGDPATFPRKGGTAPNFRPMSIVAKRLDGPRCHLVSWRYASTQAYCAGCEHISHRHPNDWMDQAATWYGGRLRPRPHCATWGPSHLPQKRGHNPQFSAYVCCGQTAGWIKIPLVRK